MTYRVPEAGVTWSSLFKLVESNREALCISDYSVSQTTLDQVNYNTDIIINNYYTAYDYIDIHVLGFSFFSSLFSGLFPFFLHT